MLEAPGECASGAERGLTWDHVGPRESGVPIPGGGGADGDDAQDDSPSAEAIAVEMRGPRSFAHFSNVRDWW